MAVDNGAPTALSLTIVTPVRLVAEMDVDIVSMPGVEGDFGALPGHQPFITSLRPGVIDYEEGGMPRRVAVSGGVVEVTQERVIVLARTAELADEIDVDRARTALQNAETRLASMGREAEEWAAAEQEQLRAQARVTAATEQL